MASMCILARIGAADHILAAAVLHDYLEDVPDPNGAETIRETVGDEVLELVRAVTENKRPDIDDSESWDVRKNEQIAWVETMPRDAVLIKAADMLHNLHSLLTDLKAAEEQREVWQRLNAGPERQLWYFESVLAAVRDRLGDHRLVGELRSAVDLLRSRASELPAR
jgi:(p)ppGpp synthase/HD superfamily hydrolase